MSGEKCQYHDAMATKIDDIHTCLLGTYKEKGLVSTVKDHDDYIKRQAKAKSSLSDWTFRCVLSLVIGFIAYKVGLRP